MQRLEVSGAVRPIYGSLGVKRLIFRYIFMRQDFVVTVTNLPRTDEYRMARQHTRKSEAL